jgi:2-polyprenyl-3-methyl-5-hydroxy-6-metoxy-1,4-benzoquinol methylase
MNLGITYTFTDNLGDEVQQIALLDILEKFNYEYTYQINRDTLESEFDAIPDNSKLIINGYLLNEHFFNGSYRFYWNFEELDRKNVQILYISIHLIKEFQDNFIINNQKLINHFRKHSPIGCRDLATVEFLKSIDVDCYFSGCLTLNLIKNKNEKLYDTVYVEGENVSIIDGFKMDPTVENYSNRSIEEINNRRNKAKKMLEIFQQANKVITTRRLHMYLPCRAYKTDVEILNTNLASNDIRFKGLYNISEENIEELKALQIKNISNFLNMKSNQIDNYTEYNRYPKIFQKIKELCSPELSNDLEILSFGCSTGEEIKSLQNLYIPNANYTGVDISKYIIKQNKLNNTSVKIFYYNNEEFEFSILKQFDVVLVMSVLCRWPNDTDYSFEMFESTLLDIDKYVKKEGYLIIYNSSYCFTDSILSSKYEPVVLDSDSGFVTKYDKLHNVVKDYPYVIFKKN